jgi:predicted nucleic acid-binding protein
MSADKFFLDTNILVYSFDPDAPEKATIAEKLVRRGRASGLGVLSYQVAQEFVSVALRRFAAVMTTEELERYSLRVMFPLLQIHSSPQLFLQALHLQSRGKLSWYDSLIVAAALQSGCKILYSEDLQHGQRFGNLVIENPFI